MCPLEDVRTVFFEFACLFYFVPFLATNTNYLLRVAIDTLQSMELRGRVLCFLKRFLTVRLFSVKLANVVSTPRPLLMGLPQGSVLSTPLYNVVMARVIPSIICDAC